MSSNPLSHTFPEIYLYDTINDANRRSRSEGFDPHYEHRGYVIEFGKSDFQIKDTTLEGTILPYPKGYARIWIDGLDNGLPNYLCRVFKPPSERSYETLEPGDVVWVKFEDAYMSQGMWTGKIGTIGRNIHKPAGFILENEEGGLKTPEKEANAKEYKTSISHIENSDGSITLNWPIYEKDYAIRKITSKFGDTKNRATSHKGIDISSNHVPYTPKNWPIGSTERASKIRRGLPGGSPFVRVVSSHDAIVDSVFFSWGERTSRLGSYVITLSSKGYANEFKTRYAHVYKPQVQQGQRIRANQIIAFVAPKDRVSSGPHLHLEVRKIVNGIEMVINPENNDLVHL